jgi:hypothetical protein
MPTSNIDPLLYGVSFSIKQCRNFGLNWVETLHGLTDDMGFRRFRIMSYWDEHEKQDGTFDFSALDHQVDIITQAGGVITLCLGARQPRWPESHWPDWAWALPAYQRDSRLVRYISKVVERYKDEAAIISYQLENEWMLKSFGLRGDFNKKRIIDEYKLIKLLDPNRPIIMSTSTSWGIPLRSPIPDMIGFSYYRIVYNKGKYSHSLYYPWYFRLKRLLVLILTLHPSFIHELQAEPWGPKNIWEMPVDEQDKSMSLTQLRKNIKLANSTYLHPIDLWGGEWWYWRKTIQNDSTIWDAVQDELTKPI